MIGRFSTLLLVIVTSSLAGCGILGADCESGETRCQGQLVQYCQPTDPGSYWADGTPCAVACHEVDSRTAFCVDSAETVTACAADGEACWDGNATYCRYGYPTHTQACDAGSTCAVVGASDEAAAVCQVGPSLSACNADPGNLFRVCDGDSIVSCTDGFPTTPVEACAGTCILDENRDATCTLTSEPDPACGDPSVPATSFCLDCGSDTTFCTAYSCVYGFVTAKQACSTGHGCSPDIGGHVAGCST